MKGESMDILERAKETRERADHEIEVLTAEQENNEIELQAIDETMREAVTAADKKAYKDATIKRSYLHDRMQWVSNRLERLKVQPLIDDPELGKAIKELQTEQRQAAANIYKTFFEDWNTTKRNYRNACQQLVKANNSMIEFCNMIMNSETAWSEYFYQIPELDRVIADLDQQVERLK